MGEKKVKLRKGEDDEGRRWGGDGEGSSVEESGGGIRGRTALDTDVVIVFVSV